MSSPLLPSILIVENDPDELFLIKRLLRKASVGNPVSTVTNGEEAIEFLRRSCLAGGGTRAKKPGLVFLDIHMPRMDGYGVLRWVRRKRSFRHTKVIMLSSSTDPRDLARAKALGADAYFVKFPSAMLMAAAIREALNPAQRGGGERTQRDPAAMHAVADQTAGPR